MKDFTGKKIREIKPSGIREFFDLASTIPGCISLGVGEPDYPTPRHIRDKAIDCLDKGITFYTANQGMPSLREKIGQWVGEHYGASYTKDEVVVTAGASEAIDVSIRAVIDPGDEVLILEPAYVCYEPDVLMAGGTVKRIQLKNENEFRLTPEELEEAIGEKTKAIILNYPNNPTGAIMEKEDLEKIVPIIEKHDLLVITDEIYAELTYGKPHCSIISFPGMRERTIYINGFSKAFSMTGWRLGYVCAPEIIIDQIRKIHQYAVMSAPTVAQHAGLEALTNGDPDIAIMRDDYDSRRKFLLSEYKRLGLPCFEPRGAFYSFPYIGDYGKTSREFCVELLEKEKLIVVPGTAFGDTGEGYIRVSYAYSIEALKEGMARLEHFLKTLKKQ